MFAQLSGKIAGIKQGFVVLDVSGVGYKVNVSAYTLGKVAGLGEAVFHIHTHVREDQLALYGFLGEDELDMFELLISISGIGPKAALGILSIADSDTIKMAIINRDPSVLTQVSGVGKKTAERVIIELQNKVTAPTGKNAGNVIPEHEALQALLSLGYNVSEGREALKLVSPDVKDIGERIRAALKLLGKK